MRVLAYCPSPLDGTAYWRVASPLGYLQRQVADFQFTIVEKVNHNLVLSHDVLLLQRPFLDEHLAAASMAHVLGRKVWCDWDDDILGVPNNNGRVLTYQREDHKRNVKRLAGACDVVTVTCEELGARLRPWAGDKIVVVPNGLDPTLDCPPPDKDKLPVRRIVWRGGDSHNEDLLEYGDAMPRVAQETEGTVLWDFVGFNPYWLLGGFPSGVARYHPWMGSTITYLRFISQLAPSFLAVPLSETAFNKAKSSISVIEASWFGAVPIVPSWLWGCELPGALTYKDKPGFEARLLEAARMPEEERAARLVDLRAAVRASWTLDTTNLLRALVLKRLSGGKRLDTWAGNREALTEEQRKELEAVCPTI